MHICIHHFSEIPGETSIDSMIHSSMIGHHSLTGTSIFGYASMTSLVITSAYSLLFDERRKYRIASKSLPLMINGGSVIE